MLDASQEVSWAFPRQKQRIILALKQQRHVVGFLGDGVNDAPALHTADVGISVDAAADVAKEAADLILLDRDLSVVQGGVREGRRTFANVQKYVLMATSSNFGNMFSMAGSSLSLLTCGVVALAVALPYSPLAPWLGFTRLPAGRLLALFGTVALYLLCAEGAKRLALRSQPD